MTSDRIPALLEPIQNRLNAAADGPWRVEQHDLSLFVFSADEGLEANLGYVGNRPEADAAFIANAPTDQARLLAAVQAVLALAEEWRYKGEFGWGAWQEGHGPDPEGAALDHASSAIRSAVVAALGGEA